MMMATTEREKAEFAVLLPRRNCRITIRAFHRFATKSEPENLLWHRALLPCDIL